MPEGELKVKAFEVILGRLMAEGEEKAGSRETGARPRATAGGGSKLRRASEAIPATAPARVLMLRDQGFFDKERSLGAIRGELKVHGWVYPLTSLSGTVQTLVQRRDLRRALASDGKKRIYHYVKP